MLESNFTRIIDTIIQEAKDVNIDMFRPSEVEIKIENLELFKKLNIISQKELDDETYIFPYKTKGALAFDLFAVIPEPIQLYGGGFMAKIPTGICIQAWNDFFDFGLEVNIRSSFGSKGLTLGNSTALCDTDYQGQIICFIINNHYENLVTIEPGERIAQAKFIPKIQPLDGSVKLVSEFSRSTTRDSNGFGTTGRF